MNKGRVEAFSDGIFAIAITLLVLTIAFILAAQFVPRPTVEWVQSKFSRANIVLQAGALGAALLVITTLGPTGVAPFIYYKF